MSDVAESVDTTQYLTFNLGSDVFAVDVAKVREILDYTNATKVPGTPDFMRGVINVRGNVVPIADMRMKFGLSPIEKTVDTCIVILEMAAGDDIINVGALVDSVEEVFELESSSIDPPPKIGTGWRTEFIKGIGKHNNGLLIVLDIDKVFSWDEVALLQSPAPGESPKPEAAVMAAAG